MASSGARVSKTAFMPRGAAALISTRHCLTFIEKLGYRSTRSYLLLLSNCVAELIELELELRQVRAVLTRMSDLGSHPGGALALELYEPNNFARG